MFQLVLFQLTQSHNNLKNNLETQMKKVEECLIENKKVLDKKILVDVIVKNLVFLVFFYYPLIEE